MIPTYREKYNAQFTPEKYRQFLSNLNEEAGYHIEFRIAETPIFVPKSFEQQLISGGNEILRTVTSKEYYAVSERAIPTHLKVPNEDPRPYTIAIDFAVCQNEKGELSPQLIEMQAFPSLFGYQHWLAGKYRQFFWVPENVSHLFNGLTNETYVQRIREWILAGENPENVVLLEIEPEKQKTRVDFELTKKMLGIDYVCISKVIREGRNLFYEKEGRKIPVKRIYNRVIFDEFVKRADLKCQFNLTEDVDVSWTVHPNWFFRISKFSMPFINSPYVPKTQFLHEVKTIPSDLENYVLKPLFSFSGHGVIFDVKREDIEKIKDPENFILQKKVQYAPVIQSPTGPVKAEIRLLYVWLPNEPAPLLTINLVRLSKGKMIGVDYNKDLDWVGGSVGFYEL
ncbi:MAG TPA: hypothetical protein PLD84_09225 [Chitinophagales bacterium]|nr:hypothetical protein [Chitinophagales bacterium]